MSAAAVREHVAAFNAHDTERLLGGSVGGDHDRAHLERRIQRPEPVVEHVPQPGRPEEPVGPGDPLGICGEPAAKVYREGSPDL